jgi:DnaJ-class molecular chaperone
MVSSLWLTFCIPSIPHFPRLQGDDLHMNLDVDLSDALVGFTTTVKGIDGKRVPVRYFVTSLKELFQLPSLARWLTHLSSKLDSVHRLS